MPHWALTAGGLVYLRRDSATVQVVERDRRTGTERRRYETRAAVPGSVAGLAVSHDGRRLLLVQADRAEADLVLVCE